MTHTITVMDDEHTRIDVDFADEGVDLQGSRTVRGNEATAERYVSVFERDLRRNHWELFPPPPEPEHDPMEDMI